MAKHTLGGNIPSSAEVGQFLSSMRVASTATRPEHQMPVQHFHVTPPSYPQAQPTGSQPPQHPVVGNNFQQFQVGGWNTMRPPPTNPVRHASNQSPSPMTNFSTLSRGQHPPGIMQSALSMTNNIYHHQEQSVHSPARQRPYSQRPSTNAARPPTTMQTQRFANPPRQQFHHPSHSYHVPPLNSPGVINGTSQPFSMPPAGDSHSSMPEQKPQRKQDEDWVEGWLQSLNKKSKPSPTKTLVTIANFKCCLQEAFKLREELGDLTTAIEAELESDEWQQKFGQINRTRVRLETLNQILTDDVTLENIKRLCEKRKAKRERLRRQKHEQFLEEQAVVARREALHRSMDKLQDRLLHNSQQEKQDKEMKASADRTLSEVRRKLTETSKTMELIKGLRKLRELRCRSFYTKGMYLGMESDDKFERQTEDLLKMLEGQMKIYETEEKTLKVMLETEQEETKEREREKQRRQQEDRVRSEQRRLRQCLFGKEDKMLEEDPLLPFKQFYRQAETSLESLVSIRQGWDMFLVPEIAPGSSTIPQDWVWPVEPSTDIWGSVIKQ